MSELFLKLLNMSISASWLVLAVILVRLLLKKAPKWIPCLLWALVAFRLICPVSMESVYSLIPQKITSGEFTEQWTDDYVGDTWILEEDSIYYDAAVAAGREPIAQEGGGYYVVAAADQLGEPATVRNTVIPVLAWIWMLGILVCGASAGFSYFRLHRRVASAILLRDRIYQSEQVKSPFVLGIFRPRIYLPFQMSEEEMTHVIAHEETHIRRWDHVSKPLGFLLLAIYWFNPVMWLAYALFCRDMELACDEQVIRALAPEKRADYSQTLLTLSRPNRIAAACPLAFGEIGVKERVKSVLNYKKPTAWLLTAGLLACIALAVCFLTSPRQRINFPLELTTVTETAQQAGISWEITDKTSLYEEAGIAAAGENFRRYDLHDPEQLRIPDYPLHSMLCGTVESRLDGGKELLTLDFTCDALAWRNSYIWAPESAAFPRDVYQYGPRMLPFEWQLWKKELVFATLLYGGFEDEEEVYQTFSRMEIPKSSEALTWYAKFPKAYFKVIRSAVAQEGEPWPSSYSVRMEVYESESQCRKMEARTSTDLLPKFPLNESTILAALEEAGLSAVISKDETTSQYSSTANVNTSYTLRDPEKTLVEGGSVTMLTGCVNSGYVAGSRQMSVLLEPEVHLDTEETQIPPFTWEEWKKEIIFAALLYGGSADEEEVYQALQKLPIEEEEKGFVMGIPYSGGYCEVKKSSSNGYHPGRIKGRYALWINFYESEEQYRLTTLETQEAVKKTEEFKRTFPGEK